MIKSLKKLNTRGFSAVATLLLLVVVGIIGGTGWYVYNSQKKADNISPAVSSDKPITTFEECAAAGNPIMESFPEQCSAHGQTFVKKIQKEFEITEWKVKMTVGNDLLDITYALDSESNNIARLSTDSYLNDPACKAIQKSDPSISLGFHAVSRHTGNEELDVFAREPDVKTFAEAAEKYPESYKKVGEYYYYYSHGNGMPCSQAHVMLSEFKEAFQTLQAAQNN